MGVMLFIFCIVSAQELSHSISKISSDSVLLSYPDKGYIHRIGLDIRPGYLIPTHNFFKGENERWKPIRQALSFHLNYAFQSQSGTVSDRIYNGAYQGLGLAFNTFGNRKEIGDPISLYMFQGARMARLSSRVTLNYEWNFGLSFGWNRFDADYNYYNKVIGSKINAYLNTNFYLSWMLSPQFDLNAGVDLTHYSNGNTKYPNAGLNTVGAKIGIVYNFNRNASALTKPLYQPIPAFPRHISYDLTLFASWRRKGVIVGDHAVPSPEAYPVIGFNFAPMYNFGYKLRAGVSLDGFYDRSANIYAVEDFRAIRSGFVIPAFHKQLALGLSGRIEYVMPYFTVGLGLGANVLHGGGDLKGLYQILALKMQLTRSSYLHIGYSLHDFHDPNFLMLGIGFRFNNKYPTIRR